MGGKGCLHRCHGSEQLRELQLFTEKDRHYAGLFFILNYFDFTY